MTNPHTDLIKRLTRKADAWDYLHPNAKRPNVCRDAAVALQAPVMTWLPNDVARCPGVLTTPFMQGSQPRDVVVQCASCLRHTAPASGDRIPYIMPPPFDFDCPLRIADSQS